MKFFYHVLVCLTFGLLVAACSDDKTTDPDPTTEHAEFMFFHAAAGVASVDVSVDGTTAITDRTFSILHDGYTELEAGNRSIAALEHGAGTALAAETFPFTEDEHYTVFLVNDELGTASLLRFQDNLAHPAAGKAHIRVAHLIADGPALKLAVPGSGQGPLFNNVKFMDNTEFFTAVNAGDVTFRVQDAGTSGGGGGGGGGSTGLFDDITVSLEEGKIYTIALVGRVADKSATAVILTHEHD